MISEAAAPPVATPTTPVPMHVAMIMDGNGRWARERGLPRVAGHRAGTENLRQIIEASVELGVKYLTLYAFSTENWRRPGYEVAALFTILSEVIDREADTLRRQGVRIQHLGTLEGVRPSLAKRIRQAVEATTANDRLILNVAFNYGARAEIVRAVRRLLADGATPDAIDEQAITEHLDTGGMPDPDLIIRTAGEMRLSNFLLWQAAYSEFWCTEVFWPDFNVQRYREAILEFGRRQRRFGALGNGSLQPA